MRSVYPICFYVASVCSLSVYFVIYYCIGNSVTICTSRNSNFQERFAGKKETHTHQEQSGTHLTTERASKDQHPTIPSGESKIKKLAAGSRKRRMNYSELNSKKQETQLQSLNSVSRNPSEVYDKGKYGDDSTQIYENYAHGSFGGDKWSRIERYRLLQGRDINRLLQKWKKDTRIKVSCVVTIKNMSQYWNISSYGCDKLNSFKPSPRHNLLALKPFEFLPQYKNPCWHETVDDQQILRCLPYMFLLGVKKSGTSELYSGISRHPDFAHAGWKESHWFGYLRFLNTPLKIAGLKHDLASIRSYTDMFSRATKWIETSTLTINRTTYHPCITGDGTPASLYVHNFWPRMPGNEGLEEPKYLNFHYIHHLVPNAKIVLIIRDPVDRYYSDYGHSSKVLKRKLSATTFHKEAVTGIQTFTNCLKIHPIRYCTYKPINFVAELNFALNIYAVYMKDILQVFPRENVLVVSFSDYSSNSTAVVNKVWDFLGLRPFNSSPSPVKRSRSARKMHRLQKRSVYQSSDLQNIHPLQKRVKRSKRPPMLQETRELLCKFFKPYNEELARMLRNDIFKFRRDEC